MSLGISNSRGSFSLIARKKYSIWEIENAIGWNVKTDGGGASSWE
jgi:hypothetical protein